MRPAHPRKPKLYIAADLKIATIMFFETPGNFQLIPESQSYTKHHMLKVRISPTEGDDVGIPTDIEETSKP
jgi:hypothetical protein